MSVVAGASRKDQPSFTLRQVSLLCERLLKDHEEKIREEYEQILNTKLAGEQQRLSCVWKHLGLHEYEPLIYSKKIFNDDRPIKDIFIAFKECWWFSYFTRKSFTNVAVHMIIIVYLECVYEEKCWEMCKCRNSSFKVVLAWLEPCLSPTLFWLLHSKCIIK